MSLLDEYRDFARSHLRENAELLYRHTATWSDGTNCRFSVQDPNKGKDVQAALTDPETASLRVLRFHPDDTPPEQGSYLPWQGGTLFLGPASDVSDFTGLASYVGQLADPRYYAELATSESGLLFMLPILPQMFLDHGQDLLIVRPGAATGGTDAEGRKQRVGATTVPVRGYLYGLSVAAQARQPRGDVNLPVPRYVVLLPFLAPVNESGWHLEYQGTAYYPLADAVDFGSRGVAWEVPLGAPGQRRS